MVPIIIQITLPPKSAYFGTFQFWHTKIVAKLCQGHVLACENRSQSIPGYSLAIIFIAKLYWGYVLAMNFVRQNIPRYMCAWWNVFACYTGYQSFLLIGYRDLANAEYFYFCEHQILPLERAKFKFIHSPQDVNGSIFITCYNQVISRSFKYERLVYLMMVLILKNNFMRKLFLNNYLLKLKKKKIEKLKEF